MTTTKQHNKNLSLVTYIIALVCLLLGLLLPLYDGKMLVTMLPSAFAETFSVLGLDPANVIGNVFTNTIDVTFFGLVTLDVGALTVLLYALITVIGVIMLIPAFVSKKTSKTTFVCANIIEVAAVVVLFIHIFNQIGYSCMGALNEFYVPLSITIAAAGTFVMLLIQNVALKKGSGVLKIVMLILGALGIASLLELTVFSFYNDTYGSISGLFATTSAGTSYSGFAVLTYFVQYTFSTFSAEYPIPAISAIYTMSVNGELNYQFMFGDALMGELISSFLAVAALLAVVNFIIDLICLSAKTTKGGLVFDCVRYILEVIAAVVAVVLLLVSDAAPGLLLYVLTAVAVISAVISIIRACVYKPAEETVTAAPAKGEYIDDTATPAPAYTYVPVYPAPAPAYEPAPAPQPAPEPAAYSPVEKEVVYKVKEVYGGPTDSFISRLNEAEKIEFAKMFIEKINGSYDNMPDYVVGGDNKEFFTTLFIYLGKFRPLLSAGLMDKIYTELNLLN